MPRRQEFTVELEPTPVHGRLDLPDEKEGQGPLASVLLCSGLPAVGEETRELYAQLIDDLVGRTLVAASTVDRQQKTQPGGNCKAAAAVGTLLAQRAQEASVKKIVFDRRGYKYHGRVKALADAARKAGLEF